MSRRFIASPEQAAEFIRQWNGGVPSMDIAAHFDWTQSQVHAVRKQLGLAPRDSLTAARIQQARQRPALCSICDIRLDCAGSCPRPECERYDRAAQWGSRAEFTVAGVVSYGA